LNHTRFACPDGSNFLNKPGIIIEAAKNAGFEFVDLLMGDTDITTWQKPATETLWDEANKLRDDADDLAKGDQGPTAPAAVEKYKAALKKYEEGLAIAKRSNPGDINKFNGQIARVKAALPAAGLAGGRRRRTRRKRRKKKKKKRSRKKHRK